jgi:hypothetical protein
MNGSATNTRRAIMAKHDDTKDTKMTILAYRKKVPATHPQFGTTLPYTDVIVYLYPAMWRMTEFGVDTGYKAYKKGMTRTEAVKQAKRVLNNDGFRLKSEDTTDENHSAFGIIDSLMIQP